MIIGVMIGGVCYIMLFYLVPYLNSGRGVLAGAIALSCAFISLERMTLLRLIDSNTVKNRVLVLGTGENAEKIGRLRRASDRRRFEIVGYAAIADDEHEAAERHPQVHPIIPIDRVPDFPGIEEIVVALDERRGTLPVNMLLRLKGRGIPVTDILDFLERETGKIDLDLLSPTWFVYTEAGYTNSVFRFAKRMTDILLSVIILLLTSPIFLFVVAAILIESGIRAPVFYRQRRVGHGNKTFPLLKFRSMSVDAEKKDGPQWASSNDNRITAIGRIIRRFRIDELPQLFNVLRGEMSIVGPRPERPEFVEMLSSEIPMYNVRHNMRPGLTGWAQLNFPYGASIMDASEKLSYDIFYIKNASITLDLLIFLQTIEVVIWGKAISMAGPPRPTDRRGPSNVRRKSEIPEIGIDAKHSDNTPPTDSSATKPKDDVATGYDDVSRRTIGGSQASNR